MTRRLQPRFSITVNDYLSSHYHLSSTLSAYEVNELALGEDEVVSIIARRREAVEKRRLLDDSTRLAPSSFPNAAYPVQYLLLGSTLGAYEVNEITLVKDA